MTSCPVARPSGTDEPGATSAAPEWDSLERAWIVSRYGDVGTLMRATELTVTDPHSGLARLSARSHRSYANLIVLLSGSIIFRNPPYHAQGRRLQARTLSLLRRGFDEAALRPVAVSLIEGALRQGDVEVAKGICFAMPLHSTSRALGLSAETASLIATRGDRLLGASKLLALRDLDKLEQDAGIVAAAIREEIDAARSQPDSGLARMLALNAEEFGLPEDDVVGAVFFLVLAGIETTASLLAHALFLLATHPEQAELAKSDPRLLDRAIEEVLRLAGPIRRTSRRVVPTGFTIGEFDVPQTAMAFADLDRAHRDPAVYSDPDRFDILRKGPPVAAFGLGAHACLGAAIARREAHVFLSEMLRLCHFSLGPTAPTWEDNSDARQFHQLHLVLKPALEEIL